MARAVGHGVMSAEGLPAVPVLDAALLEAGPLARVRFVEQLWEVGRNLGCFQLVNHSVPADLCEQALSVAEDFFALPLEEKQALDIARMPNFRGYSQMKNGRDWREQLHFGREEPFPGPGPDYLRLQGPNPWPRDERFRRVLLSFLRAMEAEGQRLLGALAEGLRLPPDTFARGASREPYLIMKLIHYLPQPVGAEPREGVAPHCDYSWLTLLLQDAHGGLQVRGPSGEWWEVAPLPGALVVNLGELMSLATEGQLVAAPHRVRHRSREVARHSIPVFLNPNLSAAVEPLSLPPEWRAAPVHEAPRDLGGHVHRVVPLEALPTPERPLTPFVFGEGEWRRKGLGVWCAECCAA